MIAVGTMRCMGVVSGGWVEMGSEGKGAWVGGKVRGRRREIDVKFDEESGAKEWED